ncbi:hypothetical protein PAXRUDRAFT_275905 [Paxillus rubicundulus Ve08.2h10]|uniref:Uncharacterized protein n=1 Tax=Paxillus rubicundulus Ve08.2h10 TaxID=930991 RepID=A0A0D0E0G4_9AGAM|nr:hypothetical protein PAXRUDRAFT_275905 [Paxillus rubicundulus Ve08.2h10]
MRCLPNLTRTGTRQKRSKPSNEGTDKFEVGLFRVTGHENQQLTGASARSGSAGGTRLESLGSICNFAISMYIIPDSVSRMDKMMLMADVHDSDEGFDKHGQTHMAV